MTINNPVYITTPIYYVNGKPHIGHAYTTIAADVLCRYQRMKGRPTFFLTGTDEHGQKVYDTAQSRGMTAQAHCDDMVVHWKAMWDKLDIQYDRFIRTTDDDHKAAVQGVLQSLFDKGLIYQKAYTGLYSVTDEVFVTEKDLNDGKYTRDELQEISETNYFFKMGDYQTQLIAHIEKNPGFIQPESRKNEVLGFLRQPLQDLCISRPKARLPWGIELPFDSEYVTYVWFDALLNYLTGIGYHPDGDEAYQHWWPATVHLIGKDILTTHSVYWSTMLMAMGVPLADCLYAHGWWTSTEGEKMSKSKGNAIDIDLLVQEFGSDVTRYFFLREKAFGADGGFSYEGFMNRYNVDLANDLGNLVHRGLSMTTKWLGGVVPSYSEWTELEHTIARDIAQAICTFNHGMDMVDLKAQAPDQTPLQFNKALTAVGSIVSAGNKYIDQTEPWVLNREGQMERLATVKRFVLELCHAAAILLLPIMPQKSAELLRRLGETTQTAPEVLRALLEQGRQGSLALAFLQDGKPVDLSDPLFPRLKELPPAIAALFDPAEEETPAKKTTPKKEYEMIEFSDFAKIQLRTGKVLEAEPHPNADRLLVLKVDVGEEAPRNIVAGIANKFAPSDLVGKQVVVVVNLKPAKLRGVVSEGMLLAAGGKEVIDLVSVNADPGEIVR